MGDALVVLDPAGNLVGHSPAAQALCGALLDHGKSSALAKLDNGRHQLPDGRWVDAQRMPLRYNRRAVSALLLHDADDHVRLEALTQRLEHQATTDLLTGLPNRVLAQDRWRQAVALAKRQQTASAVLFVDLDNFKEVNDSHGHHVGDELLVQVGNRLKPALRASDTCARLGGDEFVVVLTAVTDASDATRVGESLAARLSTPFDIGELALAVGASIGVAVYPDDADTPGALMQRADEAMYAAKSIGGGSAVRIPLPTESRDPAGHTPVA